MSLSEGDFSIFIGYDEALSHIIYAGADFIMMPSRVEPCGLNQMYAMRYGTVPIVRTTGGLKDTVKDFGDPDGYGIRFQQCHRRRHHACHLARGAIISGTAADGRIEKKNDATRF